MAAARAILEKSNDANTFYWQNAVIWTNHIFLWSGDLETFRDLAIRLEETRNRADKRAVHPFVAAIKGDFLVHCVDLEEGIRFLEAQLRRVSGAHVRAQMLIALATSVMKFGRYTEALDAVERIMLEEREFGATSWTPEVHRLRGEIIASVDGGDPAEAESALRTAIALSQSQGSLAWELRAVTTLAGLLKSQGRVREARDALSRVYDRFTEGFETSDLVAARQLLETFG
jgi:predicted ATPase